MKDNEMKSLNKELDFSISELEARLETDPLMLTTMLNSTFAAASSEGIECDHSVFVFAPKCKKIELVINM